jgi:hypothetical protein
MKGAVVIFTFLLSGLLLSGLSTLAQEGTVGTVSFITSQNVYVKFDSTSQIKTGDTLFIWKDDIPVPALVVGSKSSISCVCTTIGDLEIKVADKVLHRFSEKPAEILSPTETLPPLSVEIPPDSAETTTQAGKKPQQDISGRASISSYLNFSNTPGGNSQRMRYTFSMNAKNIANSNLTGECYVSFVQRSSQWDAAKDNIFNGLKIYNFSLRYDFSENTRVWLGRKINPKMSSIGAIDGIQAEHRFRSFTIGAFAGARPDYQDYGFNFDLFQAGAYISHDYSRGKGSMQSTLAFVDQENGWNTDRRFVYFQHYNSMLKNLYFFTSIELDVYEVVDSVQSGTFSPTNFYLLLRYKVFRDLTISLSYSARNNVIYYETYRSMVERLQDASTLQGVTLQAQYRPLPKLSLGARGSFRERKEDPKPSWNADVYVTYSQLPVIKVSLTGSVNILQNGYTKGKIFAIGVSRDLLPGKLYASLNYRYVDYRFYSNETSLAQNMAEIGVNWNIYKKLLLSLNYEGTFESDSFKYNRLFINLTQRF